MFCIRYLYFQYVHALQIYKSPIWRSCHICWRMAFYTTPAHMAVYIWDWKSMTPDLVKFVGTYWMNPHLSHYYLESPTEWNHIAYLSHYYFEPHSLFEWLEAHGPYLVIWVYIIDVLLQNLPLVLPILGVYFVV